MIVQREAQVFDTSVPIIMVFEQKTLQIFLQDEVRSILTFQFSVVIWSKSHRDVLYTQPIQNKLKVEVQRASSTNNQTSLHLTMTDTLCTLL